MIFIFCVSEFNALCLYYSSQITPFWNYQTYNYRSNRSDRERFGSSARPSSWYYHGNYNMHANNDDDNNDNDNSRALANNNTAASRLSAGNNTIEINTNNSGPTPRNNNNTKLLTQGTTATTTTATTTATAAATSRQSTDTSANADKTVCSSNMPPTDAFNSNNNNNDNDIVSNSQLPSIPPEFSAMSTTGRTVCSSNAVNSNNDDAGNNYYSAVTISPAMCCLINELDNDNNNNNNNNNNNSGSRRWRRRSAAALKAISCSVLEVDEFLDQLNSDRLHPEVELLARVLDEYRRLLGLGGKSQRTVDAWPAAWRLSRLPAGQWLVGEVLKHARASLSKYLGGVKASSFCRRSGMTAVGLALLGGVEDSAVTSRLVGRVSVELEGVVLQRAVTAVVRTLVDITPCQHHHQQQQQQQSVCLQCYSTTFDELTNGQSSRVYWSLVDAYVSIVT